jgi:hypothetical protein
MLINFETHALLYYYYIIIICRSLTNSHQENIKLRKISCEIHAFTLLSFQKTKTEAKTEVTMHTMLK